MVNGIRKCCRIFFPVTEVIRIVQLLVGETSDREIWAFAPHGSYTVKSGYALASKAKESQALHSSLNEQGVLELKCLIWKTPTIPKMCSFLWRAASGALAVAERLNTHGMNLDTGCKLCLTGSESIVHVLFNCHVVLDVWSRANFENCPHHTNAQLLE